MVALAYTLITNSAGLYYTIRNTDDIKGGQHTGHKVLNNVEQLVQFVAESQSNEAKANRDAGTQAIILQINCDNRKATQELVDGLIRNGVLKPGTVSVISPQCEETP